MTRARLALSCAAAAALTVAACDSSPSLAEAAKKASNARGPVAEQYWDVIAAIYPSISPDASAAGKGYFSVCPAGGPEWQQLSYDIDVPIEPRDQGLTSTRFVTQTEQTLRAKGWGPFAPYDGRQGAVNQFNGLGAVLSSAKDGYYVYLQQLKGGMSSFVELTVGGPCVKVGRTLAGFDPQVYDEYPFSDMSARPMPTGTVPTP